jgi:hypothetical protein
MNYNVEMGSGAVIYIMFHKGWFTHSAVNRGDIQAHRSHELTFIFFKIRKVGYKNMKNSEARIPA